MAGLYGGGSARPPHDTTKIPTGMLLSSRTHRHTPALSQWVVSLAIHRTVRRATHKPSTARDTARDTARETTRDTALNTARVPYATYGAPPFGTDPPTSHLAPHKNMRCLFNHNQAQALAAHSSTIILTALLVELRVLLHVFLSPLCFIHLPVEPRASLAHPGFSHCLPPSCASIDLSSPQRSCHTPASHIACPPHVWCTDSSSLKHLCHILAPRIACLHHV
jgi:hypothetical protein